MADAKAPQSNLDRFLTGLASVATHRFTLGSTRWDIKNLKSWTQLFGIAEVAIETPPSLHICLDGGERDSLVKLKSILSLAIQHLPIAYRWIQPASRQVALSSGDTDGWPSSRRFDVISAKSVAFHSGMKDVVVLLPPEDLEERSQRWRDYVEGSWIVAVYEQRPGQQANVIATLRALINVRAGERRHTPWLFTTDPEGKFRWEATEQYRVQPLPNNINVL